MYPLPAVDWSAFETDQITVQTRTQSGTNALNEPIFAAPTTVYQGGANLFEKSGEVVDAIEGRILERVVKVIIYPTNGVLPQIPVGARVQYTSAADGLLHSYLVIDSRVWSFEPQSLELTCDLRKSW